MSEISVGSVSVDVVPDARRFPSRVAKQVNPEAAKIGAQFGKIFGTAAQEEIARGVRDGLRTSSQSTRTQGSKQGEDFGGSFARAVKTRIEAALRSLPDVKIDADSSEADKVIAGVRANLEAIRDRKIGVDIDTATAIERLDAMQDRLRRLAEDDPDIKVKVDAGVAAAELEKFQAEVRRLDGQSAEVKVDADTAAASAQLALLDQQARGGTTAFASLLGATLLLGPALIPIGAAGAGAMAAIATGALAAAGGLGVLILALAPVIAAVQAVRQAHDKSAQSARGSTSAHLQMASAMDSVRTAQAGLKSAEEDAADARLRSAEAVENAERALGDAKRQAAQDAVDAARRLVEAERGVADAQRDALQAQRDLADARRQAARDAEDLAARVAGGVLDERDATLRLQEARQRAAEVLSDPTATQLERERAQLAVDQAVQGLQDQQRENIRLRQEKAATDKAGIDGAKGVVDAQERVRQSQQKVRDAQAGVALAVEDASRRQVKSAESVADAQRRVADATRDAAQQQRRSAESIASAQQAVVAAQRGVQQASQSAGAAGGAAYETMRQKLAALSPAGRDFVGFITGELLPALRPLGDAAQTAVLPGLQSALKELLPVIPQVSKLIGSFGRAVGDLAGEAVDSLRDPIWRDFFAYLQSDGADIMKTVARTAGNFAKAFAGLVTAFKPVTDVILAGLLKLSQKFADFAGNASPTSGLGRFIGYIQDVGPQVVDTFAAIAGAVGHILEALAPLAPLALTLVTGFANMIAALPQPVIITIVAAIAALSIAVTALSVASTIAAGATVTLGTTLVPIVLIVAGVIAIVAALGLGLYELWKRSETFRDIVKAVWSAVQTVISTAGAVIGAVFRGIRAYIANVLVPVFTTFLLPQIKGVWTAIQIAFDIGRAAIQIAFGLIQIAIKVFAGIFSALYSSTIKPTWDLIRPIFSALGNFIADHVAPAFQRGVDAIAKAWEGIKEATKAPVRFVVDTVINGGIIDTFNRVAGFFKVDPVDHIHLPKGFATGGYVSGPGGPREDKIPAMLSNGEFVINAAATARNLDLLKYLNEGGSLGGDPGGVARFAKGGLVEETMAWLPSVDPLPYVWGAVGPNAFDCSGLVGEVWNRVTDHIRNSRVFTTSSNLGGFGFAPGPGVFTVGVNPGQHMVGNLGGLGFEARSTATGIFVGPSATSPTSMRQVLHLDALPGGGKTPKGISLLHPIDSFRHLFDAAFDGAEAFASNPFGQLALAMPKTLISGIGDFVSDHVPGFADGGLVTKYDDGGYLPPGLTTVLNATGKPEPVFTAGQWSSLRDGGSTKPTVQVTQNITNPVPERPSESLAVGMRKLSLYGLLPAEASL
jgi:hypothetical protein